jgi:fatty acid desaturase
MVPPPAQTTDDRPREGSEYAALSRLVRQQGLLERRRGWYIWRISVTFAALAAGWTAFVLIGNSWWQLAVAVFLAVVFGQLGFLGHDAGHRQVFTRRRTNYLFGIACGNLAIGLSYGWWVSKHNRHHANPNTEGEDPDIMIGVLAFTGRRVRAAAGLQRLVFRYQAYLLVPMLLFESAGLHGSSIRALLNRGPRSARAIRSRPAEAALLALHFAAYLSVVFLVLSPVKAVVFILVQQGLFGFYLGCSFAPNHKGMPVFDPEEKVGFLHRQVLTSRNVRGGWLTDLALGGLNYQIEHHLFPSMPRPSLRRAQPLIAAFCAEHGVSYTESSLLGSYAQGLRHLNQVGRQAKLGRVTTDPATAAAP